MLNPSQRQWLINHKAKLVLLEYHDNPPLEFRNDNGKWVGISNDYIHLIEEKLGFTFQRVRVEDIKQEDWMEFLASHVVTKCNLQKTPERMKHLLFTAPYVELPHAIIVRKEIKGELTLEDMERMKISIVNKYAIHELLSGGHPQFNFDIVEDHVAGLRHVAFHASDAMIINFATASYYIEKEGLTNLRFAGTVGSPNRLSLASGKNFPEFHSILKLGLAAITDKERKAIFNRWITLDQNIFINSKKFWIIISFITLFVILATASVSYINRLLQKQVMEKTNELQVELAARKRMEKQLLQAQKMEAIGTFANGIAHDFNNVLGTIVGYGEMMEMFDTDRETREGKRLDKILQAAYRGQDLVNQILTFSRRAEHNFTPVELGPVLIEVLDSIRATLPSGVNIIHTSGKGGEIVLGDPTQLHQVFMNLCVNGMYAMEEKGGVLTVELNKIDFISDSRVDTLEPEPNKYYQITISDTGTGMSNTVIERIFEPFYTTRKGGKGTGMGLAICHGIIKSIHGTIEVQSSQGKGSTFSVFLPLHDGLMELKEAGPKQERQGHKGSILVVDDDEGFLAYLCELLEQYDHQVVAESNSLIAWQHFLTDPSRYDLVITDQDMPHLTGLQLIKKLKTITAEVPLILCTSTAECLSKTELENLGVTLVTKPVGASRIIAIVDGILGKRPTRES